MSDGQKRIAAAVIFAAGLISVALFMRVESTAPTDATAAVAVAPAPERSPIVVRDSNNDGVPDWQESLQTSEPVTIEATTETTYEPPDTLTEEFALEFFEKMVRAENYGDFGDSPEELVANAGNTLADKAYDTFLGDKDIVIDRDNSKEAMARYGESVAAVIISAPDGSSENEASILERALRNQDPGELEKLETKLVAYQYMLEESKKIAVPSLVKKQHLDLLNTYQALIADLEAMRYAFDDPMMALLRMKRYQDDADGLYASIANVYTVLVNRGAVWSEESIVYSVISLEGNN